MQAQTFKLILLLPDKGGNTCMFSSWLVCVCLSVVRITEKLWRDSGEIFPGLLAYGIESSLTFESDLGGHNQWLKWFCEAGGGGSPDEARLEQTPYPFQPH